MTDQTHDDETRTTDDDPREAEADDDPRGPEADDDPREPEADEPLDPTTVDRAAAARSGLYALLARLFEEPDERTYRRLADGDLDATCRELVAASGLDLDPPDLTVEDDHDTLCARFNDLFTVGYAEYEDRTDGSLDSTGPPVSLYETAYRPEASWNDVNLDLARAYDYFGLEVDQTVRDNHDYLPYQLEFAGYLARLAAAGETGPARARLDLHDRHLHVVAGGLADRMAEETGTGLYGELAAFLADLVETDQSALAERVEGGAEG
jgi:DMSO reductase family type II enzyme chaperone